MADVQNFSGLISPVANLPTYCGNHIGWGAAPVPLDPWGFWWDNVLDAPAITNGNATVTTLLPKGNGTAGQVLTSNGASAVPTYQAIPAPATQGFYYESTKRDQAVANVNGLSALFSFDQIAASLMSVVGRRLILTGKGLFSTALGETPTLQLDCYMLASSRASVLSAALTASVTNGPFDFEFIFHTATAGGAGVLKRSGKMTITLDGTAFTTYLTVPVVDTNIDLTQAITPAITVTTSSNLTSVMMTHSSAFVM